MIKNVTINSLLTGSGTDYTLIGATGFVSPELDLALTPRSGRHGTILHRALWRARRISLTYALRAGTVSEYAVLRRNLIKAFALPPLAATTTMYITTTDDKALQMDVNIANVMEGDFEPGEITTGKIRIELIAPDTNLYGQAINQQTMTTPVAGGATLPATLPFAFASSGGSYALNNDGNGIVYPTIYIYGLATNANIRNITTGESFSIAIGIPAGNYVVIDLENQTVLLNGITNYLQYFDGDFIYLKAGVNTVTFSSDENNVNSYATIEWRNAYIGI